MDLCEVVVLCADSRFAEPRISFWKGFNCCGAKLRLQCADSRLAEPRSFPERENGFILFACTKRTKKHARGLRTSGLRGRFKALSEKILAEFSDGTSRNRFFAQNGGEKALNRCERVTVVQTQDGCFSKKDYYTASSQWVFADEIYSCTLALVQCEFEFFVC